MRAKLVFTLAFTISTSCFAASHAITKNAETDRQVVSDFSKLSVEDASLKTQVAISQNKLTLAANTAKLAKITGQNRNGVNTSAARLLSVMVFGDKRFAELSQGGMVSRVTVGDHLIGGFVVSKITKNTVVLNNTTTHASRTLVLEHAHD